MADLDNEKSILSSKLDEGIVAESYARFIQLRKKPSLSVAEIDNFVDQFEAELAVKKPQELIRWFLLSVVRYLHSASWTDIEESGLSLEEQEDLSIKFMAFPGAYKSLASTLKRKNLRYVLVGFSNKADPDNNVLSIKTKAFGLAIEMLDSKIQLKKQAVSASEKHKDKNSTTDAETSNVGSAASRRSARRNGAVSQMAFTFQAEVSETEAESIPGEPITKSNPSSADVMNDEEFGNLEKLLLDNKKPSRGVYRTNESRISLLAGVALGWALFLLWWLVGA